MWTIIQYLLTQKKDSKSWAILWSNKLEQIGAQFQQIDTLDI